MRKPRNYWNNKDVCYAEAKKYKSKVDFQRKNGSAYRAACKNKWLDEWFEPLRQPMTYERFMEIAKDCKTKKEVENIDSNMYNLANKKGWFKDCPWIPGRAQPKPRKWTEEARLEAAKKCKTRTEYQLRFPGAHKIDWENGWLDKYTWLKRSPVNGRRHEKEDDYVIYKYADYENKVVYIGLTYEERKQLRHQEHVYGRLDESGNKIYDAAAKYWNSIGKDLPEPTYIMEELKPEEASFYEEWYRDRFSKNGWRVLNKVKGGSLGGNKVKWDTYEKVAEEAKKYETRKQFSSKSVAAAKKAYNTYTEDGVKWIDTFTWFKSRHQAYSDAAKAREANKRKQKEVTCRLPL